MRSTVVARSRPYKARTVGGGLKSRLSCRPCYVNISSERLQLRKYYLYWILFWNWDSGRSGGTWIISLKFQVKFKSCLRAFVRCYWETRDSSKPARLSFQLYCRHLKLIGNLKLEAKQTKHKQYPRDNCVHTVIVIAQPRACHCRESTGCTNYMSLRQMLSNYNLCESFG